MGFNCKFCGEREVWASELPTHPRVCWDCHRERYPETETMRKHREMNQKYDGCCVTSTTTTTKK